ncbi:hypothetical protein [Mycolicibacterium aubagnense]|uniref:Uncharacterized protein n=1 Tax=Mycolicibacterium aubagnense TaxID=319707 RepID=A0ABM7I6N0_9MYCO|nr:hypothetical protein [Mycolicibacterium aubagnense]TLH64458.1 hypothetical protein C1S80_12335 [Mycolicibacterium aubagnense]BBX82192.1 hypothetical protein MAUB_00650 [Mycolicibacterium aubagnense]
MLDVEATSHTPMSGVMTEFALVHVITGASFYGHLYRAQPDPENPVRPVVERGADGIPIIDPYWIVNGKDSENATSGETLRDLAQALSDWVERLGPPRRILVSDNNGYDAMWLNCFTDSEIRRVLFGHSSRRIGDFYAGTRGKWSQQSAWKRLRRTPHTHHPLDDARGNVEALQTVLRNNNLL